MSKPNRNRRREVKSRHHVAGVTVGEIVSVNEDGTPADGYLGRSYLLVPLVVEADTPEQASRHFDNVLASIQAATAAGGPVRLAVRDDDGPFLVRSLREALKIATASAERHAARRARDN